jgi:hypothetical protein
MTTPDVSGFFSGFFPVMTLQKNVCSYTYPLLSFIVDDDEDDE